MLAGPQAIGAMVPALARVDVCVQRPDLHRVGAAARRHNPVITEGVRSLIECVHLDDLGAAAPLPAPDLVRIRRNPSPKRGRSVILQTPASRGGLLSQWYHVEFHVGAAGAGLPAGPSVFTARPTVQARHRRRLHGTTDAGQDALKSGTTHRKQNQSPSGKSCRAIQQRREAKGPGRTGAPSGRWPAHPHAERSTGPPAAALSSNVLPT